MTENISKLLYDFSLKLFKIRDDGEKGRRGEEEKKMQKDLIVDS